MRHDKCPKCGSTEGLRTILRIEQYYTWQGEPNGYSQDFDETKYAACIHCGKRIRLIDIITGDKECR